jgi:RNA ligase (TIGR02306 family)
MNLASVQRIDTLSPIEGADRIERATMVGLGWDCVVRKGEFKPGDLCVYIIIDAIIPKYLLSGVKEDAEMVRLRTVKMKKQISQGLILNINVLDGHSDFVSYGGDVTEFLGIKKYEKAIPAHMQGLIKGDFPPFIPKTDEERIQNDPRMIPLLTNKPSYITMKMDGTSLTTYRLSGDLEVCSRNMKLKEGENVYWQMARKYSLDTLLPNHYAIQGEVVGPGIQKNLLGLTEADLYVFNVWELHEDGPSIKVAYPANKNFVESIGMKFVPVLKEVKDGSTLFPGGIDAALQYSSDLNYPSGKPAEGIVVRLFDQSLSFKVVSNRYLLKEEE